MARLIFWSWCCHSNSKTRNDKPLSTEQTEVLWFPIEGSFWMRLQPSFRPCFLLFVIRYFLVQPSNYSRVPCFPVSMPLSCCSFCLEYHSTFPFSSIFIFSILEGIVQMPFLNPSLSHPAFDNISPFWTPIELYLYLSLVMHNLLF